METEAAAASGEKRRALRLLVDLPITIESIGQPNLALHPALARIYRRVRAAEERRGESIAGALRDLSTNGAFIAADPLPLLSRVSLRFQLDALEVDAIGWILWLRTDDCVVAAGDRPSTPLPRGFGVLFESIPLEARLLVTKLVNQAARRGPPGRA